VTDPTTKKNVYNPLSTTDAQAVQVLPQLLPVLLDTCTASQSSDLPPRINVNTCSQTVLQGLQQVLNPSTSLAAQAGATTASQQQSGSGGSMGSGGSGGSPSGGSSSSQGGSSSSSSSSSSTTLLSDTEIQNILSMRPSPTNPQSDPIYNTPAWLYTQGAVSMATLKAMAKYITARTQVYSFQAVGYFDKGGPVARVEAVVDTNQGQPRIVYIRNLTELGRAFDMSALRGSGGN
jgi:hypothetical protein